MIWSRNGTSWWIFALDWWLLNRQIMGLLALYIHYSSPVRSIRVNWISNSPYRSLITLIYGALETLIYCQVMSCTRNHHIAKSSLSFRTYIEHLWKQVDKIGFHSLKLQEMFYFPLIQAPFRPTFESVINYGTKKLMHTKNNQCTRLLQATFKLQKNKTQKQTKTLKLIVFFLWHKKCNTI